MVVKYEFAKSRSRTLRDLVLYVLNVPFRILQSRSGLLFSQILYSRMTTIVKP